VSVSKRASLTLIKIKNRVYGLIIFSLVLGLILGLSGVVSGERPVVQTIFTDNPPILDGNMGAVEWDNLGITMTPPSYDIEAYAYFMNDNTYLYVLVDAVGDNTSDIWDECLLVFNFTNNTIIKVFGNGSMTPSTGFNASVGYGPSPNNATNHMIYEIRIPLSMININPGDSIDFCSPFWKGYSSIVYDAATGRDNVWPIGLDESNISTWGILETSACGCVGENYVFTCGANGTINESCNLTCSLTSAGTCFTVGADDIVINGNGFSITGDGTGDGIFASGKNNVTIKNFNVYDFYEGIHLYNSSNNTITNNTANNITDYGIWLFSSSNNKLNNNTANDNKYGIVLSSSSNNNLTSNTANDNTFDGIYLSSSNNNDIIDNIIYNNTDNGIYLTSNSWYNKIINNDVLENNIGIHLGTFTGNNYNDIINNTVNSNQLYGIYLETGEMYNNIINNTANNNGDGIYLDSSSNNNITNNTANDNDYSGINLYSSSNNNITNNTANDNKYGFFLMSSSNNTLKGNTANINNFSGIWIQESSENNITNNTVTNTGCGETYHISQLIEGSWQEIYVQPFETQYTTKEFNFSKNEDGEIKLRIIQKDTAFGDVEQIKLNACGQDMTPEYAIYTENDRSVLEDILEIDKNVTVAHEKEIEVMWSIPETCGEQATLYLTANEYRPGTPFRSPPRGNFNYAMQNLENSITVDGVINETDGISSPQYSPFWRPTTGHPDGHTYIYISDDQHNLYISLDITMDNTDEYGEDWAEITVILENGEEKIFRIDDFTDTYGKCGFGMTGKVDYKHQTCEFSIPKSEIGNDNFNFSLRYYGTGASTVTGIGLEYYSHNNTVSGNTVTDNCGYGIIIAYDYNSSNNTVTSNTFCSNSEKDVYDGGSSNSGYNNTCDTTYNWNDTGAVGCTYSCPICGCVGENYVFTCGANGTINESCNLTCDLNSTSTCFTIGADDITIDCAGFLINGSGSYIGINSPGYSGITIKNCNITWFQTGIYFEDSVDNLIQNNNLMHNGLVIQDLSGIHFDNVTDSSITGNNASFNDYGIYLTNSEYNNITNNTANNNTHTGIYLYQSGYNNVSDNAVNNNCGGIINPPQNPTTTFHISQLNAAGTWEELYVEPFPVEYATKEFEFNKVDGEVKLRIIQKNTDFADIDGMKLKACDVDLVPEYAVYTENGMSVLEDVLEIDNNVVIVHEKEIEISWDIPGSCTEKAVLYLTANEYWKASPFRFPVSSQVSYEMNSSKGSITVDGFINETDGVASPLYSPFWEPSTGHPAGYTYIYVSDDTGNVYISLDVTGDNTNEYGEDWAEITIISKTGEKKTFRIDDFNDSYGKCGFGLTSRVSYKHQTCEFAIPKSLIGDDDFKFILRYYGTYAQLAQCAGISLYGSSYNTLDNNNVISNFCGVVTMDGTGDSYNNIANNKLFYAALPGGECCGILFANENNSNIIKNTVNENYHGICLNNAGNNNLVDNTVNNNQNHGIYIMDGGSAGNIVNLNTACFNGVINTDIHNEGTNTGDNNTCDTTYIWNDTGALGCTYSCGQNINNIQINLIDPPLGEDVCINKETNITTNLTINAVNTSDPRLENVSVCINVSCDGGYVLNETVYGNFSGILSANITFTVAPTTVGQCNVTTCVDCDDTIFETDETDNCGNTTFSVINCSTCGCDNGTYNYTCGETIMESCVMNCNLNSNGTCFTIGADNIAINGNGFSITGNTTGNGIYANGRNNVNIKDFKIYNFSFGIYLNSSSNSTLTNNTANSNDEVGIGLLVGSNNTLTNNTANYNYDAGIYLYYSNNTDVMDNTANSNEAGIVLEDSNNSTLTNNTANSNDEIGIGLDDSNNNTLTNNTANNNTAWGIYLKYSNETNITGNTLNSNYQGIKLEDSANNTISKNSLDTYSDQGIYIYHNSPYNRLLDNNVSGGASYSGNIGISLDWADHSILIGNRITNNRGSGINIGGNSQYVLVDNNDIINNSGYWGWGVAISSSRNNVTNNNINFNDVGVNIHNYRQYNIISNNTIDNNNEIGIYLFAGDDDTINDNKVRGNGEYGIYIFNYSKDNTINRNIVCQNVISDFYVNGTPTGNSGNNNTCNTPDGWDDDGTTTGCTYHCPALCGCDNGTYNYTCGETVYESCNLTCNLNSTGTCFTVGADDITINGNGHTITGNISGVFYGIYLLGISDVTIQNTKITNFSYGIYLNNNANNNKIINHTGYNNSYGIYVVTSSNNTINENNYYDNAIGIRFSSSSGNHIYNTIASNNNQGIYLDNSDNNSLYANNICNNTIIDVYNNGTGNTGSYDRCTTTYNFACDFNNCGKSCYGEGEGGAVVPNELSCCAGLTSVAPSYNMDTCMPEMGAFKCINCGDGFCNATAGENYCSCQADCPKPTCGCGNGTYNYTCGETITDSCIMNCNLTSNGTCFTVGANDITIDGAGYSITGDATGYGISMTGRNNVTIKNFNVYNFSYGIYLQSSSGNTLTGNTASNNSLRGIYLQSSSGNLLNNNKAKNNNNGLYLESSPGNTLTGNTANDNNHRGIFLYSSSSNNLTGNNASNNQWNGLHCRVNSNDNIINSNTFCSNNQANGSYYDIRDESSNSGDNNTCDTVYKWNDTGTEGCTYICPPCEDNDGDGYGVCPGCGTTHGCEYEGDDCDDTDDDIYPDATERCNGLDDDCDEVIDEGCYRSYGGSRGGGMPYYGGGGPSCNLSISVDGEYVNETMQIKVTEQDGGGIEGAIVDIYYNNVMIASKNTDTVGEVEFVPDGAGAYKFIANYPGCGEDEDIVNVIDRECYNDGDCSDTQVCVDWKCSGVECACGEVKNHSCMEYDCCEDADCAANERCVEHECVPETPELQISGPETAGVGDEVEYAVLDDAGNPVGGAEVTITYDDGTSDSATSNADGKVSFIVKDAGTASLNAEKIGYGSGEFSTVAVAGGCVTDGDCAEGEECKDDTCVPKTGFPWYVILVLIFLILLILFLLTRRRREGRGEE